MTHWDAMKEDDEFIYAHRYLHDEPEGDYPKWLEGRPHDIKDAYEYAFYEIRVDYRIRKSDGRIFYDKVTG